MCCAGVGDATGSAGGTGEITAPAPPHRHRQKHFLSTGNGTGKFIFGALEPAPVQLAAPEPGKSIFEHRNRHGLFF